MEFNMKSIRGFAAEAATVFSRAVQYTEEKFGTSEKTELDAHFDGLALRSDRTKHWTERIVSRTDAVLQPNPNTRVEDYLFEKLDKRRERQSNFDLLGQDMIDAGADIGSSTPYGSALIKVGRTQQRLGTAERDFIRASMTTFVGPLKRFLDGDMKTIMKERKILENKRLDLDACKNRLRKARSMEGQANAETELRISQAEFDRQAEITRLLLEGISSAHANHLRCLNDFVEAQAAYYAQCQQFMIDLQKELSSRKRPFVHWLHQHIKDINRKTDSAVITRFCIENNITPKWENAKISSTHNNVHNILLQEVITIYKTCDKAINSDFPVHVQEPWKAVCDSAISKCSR